MNKDLKKIQRQLKSVVLTSEEKKFGRVALIEFMTNHPAVAATQIQERKSPVLFWRLRWASITVGTLIILLIAGTGISYAAESSLPGDILYPVKIQINEAVKTKLARTVTEKNNWEADKLQRRLDEAAQLTARHKLTPPIKASLASEISSGSQRVTKNVDDLNRAGAIVAAAELSSKLEGALTSTKKIFDTLDTEAKNTDSPLTQLILDRASSTSALRQRLEEKFATSTTKNEATNAASNKSHVVKKNITQTSEKIRKLTSKSKTSDLNEPLNMLAQAKKSYQEGNSKLKSGDSAAAFKLFQESERLSEQAAHLAVSQADPANFKARNNNRKDNETTPKGNYNR